ncbi:thiolase family protein [Sporomusa termitida]|uniref:acetyl-CoA C-acetyltransferase n=1 Tax=Sporomusa termitida TaxID=2377 RepID=A0A517DSF0_9FIRM|nr:thiolase family protein [Sporomusa termitida]QDR80284.1 Acetyl-CoA acetyltransferase [Sporomusa termitida]
MLERVFIIAAKRTAIGKLSGTLKDVDPVDLAANLFKGILAESQISPDQIEQVHLGCCTHCQANEGVAPVIARQALIKAGMPLSVVSSTVDRACTSGTWAVKVGYDAIRLREADIVLVGGTEVMSRTPHLARGLRSGVRLGAATLEDPLYPLGYKGYEPVAAEVGQVSVEYGVTREMQDAWALRSQTRYQEALKAGKWKQEILPIEVKNKKSTVTFEQDEFPKADTTIESLSSLRTVFGSPTVTAGNAPGLNDGAAAMILVSETRLKELGIKPLAEVLDFEFAGGEPKYMGTVPGTAIKDLLKKNQLTIDQVSCIEINEAFAAVPLLSSIILGNKDDAAIEKIREKINVNGGAVAMGHPVGATGTRIIVTLLYELQRRGGGYGVASLCGGLAQGDAILIKV